jgi:salicylate hydroxylase
MHRADLHGGLLSLAPPDRVRLGARLVAVTQSPEEARLHLSDGTTVAADLVVGADGIHSIAREQIVADQPRYSGQTIYRGLVPAERVPFLLTDPRVQLWLGPDQHCVCYPVSSGRQVSFGATVSTSDWGEESWSAGGDVAQLAAPRRRSAGGRCTIARASSGSARDGSPSSATPRIRCCRSRRRVRTRRSRTPSCSRPV